MAWDRGVSWGREGSILVELVIFWGISVVISFRNPTRSKFHRYHQQLFYSVTIFLIVYIYIIFLTNSGTHDVWLGKILWNNIFTLYYTNIVYLADLLIIYNYILLRPFKNIFSWLASSRCLFFLRHGDSAIRNSGLMQNTGTSDLPG